MTGRADPALPMAGRSVLVTGGARGLGREMAIALAQAGADVAIGASRAGETLDRAAEALRAIPSAGRVLALGFDVTDAAACEEAVGRCCAAFGHLDVAVCNAGLGMRIVSETFTSEPTRFWETAPSDWARIVDANLNGAFHVARAAAARMVARGSGKIVTVSTSERTMTRRGYAPYGPSKAALEAASRIWAQDLDGTGVTVNVYLPGGAADTALIPPASPAQRAAGKGRSGADGNLLPASVMRRGIVWLASARSDGHTGGRYVARSWDETLAPDEAAAGARRAWPPPPPPSPT